MKRKSIIAVILSTVMTVTGCFSPLTLSAEENMGSETTEENVFYEVDAALEPGSASDTMKAEVETVIALDDIDVAEEATEEKFFEAEEATEADVNAGEASETDVKSGTAGDLQWELSDGTLTISGNGTMTETPWQDMKKEVVHLVIGDGVTSISNEAFYNFYNIIDISVGEGVKSIDPYAFSSCYSLQEIVIPNTVETLEYKCFSDCRSLKKVTVNAAMIGNNAFSYCYALKELVIGDGVESIGSNAFDSCSIEEIKIPGSVQYIYSDAFSFCVSLKSVSVNATRIGNYAFRGCKILDEVTLGDNVKSIYSQAFNECDALKTIELPHDVDQIDADAFSSTMEKIIYPGTKAEFTEKNLNIPFITVECNDGDITSSKVQGSYEDITWEIDGDTLSIGGSGALLSYSIPWEPYASVIKKMIIGDGITSINTSAISFSKEQLDYIKYNDTKEAWYQNTYDNFMYQVEVECTDGIIKPRCDLSIYSDYITGIEKGYYEAGKELSFNVKLEKGLCNPRVYLRSTKKYYYDEKTTELTADASGIYSFEVPAGYASIYVSTDIEPGQWVYDEDTKTLTIKSDYAYNDYPEDFPEELSEDYYLPWYEYAGEVEKLILEDGVTEFRLQTEEASYSYGKRLIYDSLKHVSLPDSLTYVSDIGGCPVMEEIVLPYADFEGFGIEGWDSLKSFSINDPDDPEKADGIYIFDNGDFSNLKSLETLTLPKKIETEGGDYPFPKSLKTINYSGTMEEWKNTGLPVFIGVKVNCSDGTIAYDVLSDRIEDGKGGYLEWTLDDDGVLTFKGNRSLYFDDYEDYEGDLFYGAFSDFVRHIKIESGITRVGGFSYYPALEEIVIPATVTRIGAFGGCVSLKTITYGGTKEQFLNAAGDKVYNVTVICSDGEETILLEKNGTDCDGRINWSIKGDTLTISGEGAYDLSYKYWAEVGWNDYRDDIKHLIIEEGITSIGGACIGDDHQGLFLEMNNLEDVKLPSSLKSIDDIMDPGFGGCGKLKEIEIPENLTFLANGSFDYCDSLEKLILPANFYENLSENGSLDGFKSIRNLKKVEFKGTKEQWAAIMEKDKEDGLIPGNVGEETIICTDGTIEGTKKHDSSSSSRDDSSSSAKESSGSDSTKESSSDSTKEGSSSDSAKEGSSSDSAKEGSSSDSAKDGSSSDSAKNDSSSSESTKDSSSSESTKESSGSDRKKDDSSSSAADSADTASVNMVPLTKDAVVASSKDNFAAEAPEKKIGKMVLNFENVGKNSVSADELAITVVKGTKLTTPERVTTVECDNPKGIKAKINKKTGLLTLTPKVSGKVTIVTEAGKTYKLAITVDAPKAQKAVKNQQINEKAQIKLTLKDLFSTTVDRGELTAASKANQATVSDNNLIITPKQKDTIKVTYVFVNKKFKTTIKVK